MSEQTIIEVQLTAGRYHAHPWGVSQYGIGEPEWPPSPWRLVRALAAAWFNAYPQPCSVEERDRLLKAFGKWGRPTIVVPRTAFRELQFFQPVLKDGKVNQRADHRDCFALPEGGRFWFVFPLTLDDSQRKVLADLLMRVRYLGRSESRAVLTLCDHQPDTAGNKPTLFRAKPVADAGQDNGAVFHVREVLCPGVSANNGSFDFDASDIWRLRNDEPDNAHQYLPEHLSDVCLKVKRPLPDGCEWVDYVLPAEAIVPDLPRRRESPKLTGTVEVTEVWFRISRRIPIPISETVRLARAFRDAVVMNYERLAPDFHSVVLTGKNEDGTLEWDHMHCYYLPRPESTRRRWIERLVVYVPAHTLNRIELEALLSVSRVHMWKEDPYPVSVVAERQEKIPTIIGKRSHVWQSLTPYVMPLGRARRCAGEIVEQLGSSLAHIGVSAPLTLRGDSRRSSVTVHNYSSHDAAHGRIGFMRRLAHWVEVEFDEDMEFARPAIGADAHFGLGQFEPAGAAKP